MFLTYKKKSLTFVLIKSYSIDTISIYVTNTTIHHPKHILLIDPVVNLVIGHM